MSKSTVNIELKKTELHILHFNAYLVQSKWNTAEQQTIMSLMLFSFFA
jgi:hypothetical protein